MNYINDALALIRTFASGDSAEAASLLAKDYIQHNLAYPTGADAFLLRVMSSTEDYASRALHISSI